MLSPYVLTYVIPRLRDHQIALQYQEDLGAQKCQGNET